MITFFEDAAIKINHARLNHFLSLDLNIKNMRILETGCGAAGFFTSYLENNSKEVLSIDARQDVIEAHKRAFPHRSHKLKLANLNTPDILKDLGEFDLAFCYGTLYHLSNPEVGIKNIAEAGKMSIIETICHPIDNGLINRCIEDANNPNQSFDGGACRPARDWILMELNRYYKYTYITKTQPKHIEFPRSWPVLSEKANSGGGYNTRAVFLGSHTPMNDKYFSQILINSQTTNSIIHDLYKQLKAIF